MKRRLLAPVTVLSMLALTGCQMTGGGKPLSLEDAKKVSADFSQAGYTAPQRSAADVLERYKRWSAAECHNTNKGTLAERRQWVRNTFEKAQPLTNWYQNNRVYYARTQARDAFIHGDVHNAIVFIGWAEEGMNRSTLNEWTGWSSVFSHLKAVYLTYAGDLEGAREALSIGDRQAKSDWRTVFLLNWARSLANRATASVLRHEGKFKEAVERYRDAIDFGDRAVRQARESIKRVSGFFEKRIRTTQIMTVTEMASALIGSGQAVEAESRLREAVLTRKYDGAEWMARVAGLRELANALHAQGRIAEALELADAVTGMYRADCSTTSLGAAALHALRGKSHLALGDPAEALAAFAQLQADFEGEKALLSLKYDDNVDWAFAEVLAGKPETATSRLERALEVTRSRLGDGSTKEHLIRGGMGLLKLSQGDEAGARPLLGDAVTALLADDRKTDGWLRAIVLEGYLDLLSRSQDAADAAEAFRVAQNLQTSSVERALGQNAARAGANDPELARLIREQQDLEWKIELLQATLTSALSSPDKKSVATAENIRNTLPALEAEKQALRARIAAQFPRYDNLIDPKPLTVADVQQSIKPDQALVVMRTFAERTYVWAVPKSGAVSFAAVDLGRDELAQKVGELRVAVDPGAIATLGDIPPFDVGLAHRLYAQLLEPVKAGWQGARNIVAIAQGPAAQLPLSLLPTEAVTAAPADLLFAEYRAVPWLAKSHAITLLPSVAALNSFAATARPEAAQAFVGFGDPFFNLEQASAAAAGETVQVAGSTTVRGLPVALRSLPRTRAVDSADLALLPRLPETAGELKSIAATMGADPNDSVFLGKAANEDRVKGMDLENVAVLAFATHGLVPGDLDGLDQPALAMSAPAVAGIGGDGLLTMGEILTLKLGADWVVLSACNTASADGAGDEALGRARALQGARIEMIDKGVYKDAAGQPVFSYAHPIFWAPFTIVGDGGGKVAVN